MIKHICPICKKVWYCKGTEICEKEWARLEKPMGGCICSVCTLAIPDDDCEVVRYGIEEWRIA